MMRRWVDRHLGVPPPVATLITGGVIRSLRGYFRGVTLVAAFNGVVVGLASLALGVPLAGTIGVVTFITAYVPYIGAFVAGAFAVVIALGANGTTTALVMLLVVILANGLLQNIVQPFAMGSALDLHPLVVLVLTIGGRLHLRDARPGAGRADRLGDRPHQPRSGAGPCRGVGRPGGGRRGRRRRRASLTDITRFGRCRPGGPLPRSARASKGGERGRRRTWR